MGVFQCRLLSVVWALALIISLNTWYLWVRTPLVFWPQSIALVAALAVLVRPGSRWILQVAVLGTVCAFLYDLPAIPNHRMVLLLAGLTLFVGASSHPSARHAVSTLRWLTVIVYAFAFLAKLNVSYLDSSTSCASRFFREALDLHGLLDSSSGTQSTLLSGDSLVGWWSALSELALIALLLPTRTRRVGVVLGIGFHLLLATHFVKYFANFSASMFVLLCCWLDETSSKRLFNERLWYWRRALLCGALGLCLLSILAAYDYITALDFVLYRYVIWSLYGLYMLYAVAVCFQGTKQQFGIGRPIWIIVLLAFIHGASPYLGIKTRSGFSMYSNLRIEPNYSNHLFMPPGPDPFGLLGDTVEITSVRAEHQIDQNAIVKGTYPYIALCSYIDQRNGLYTAGRVEFEFVRNGDVHTTVRGAPVPEDCPPWILRKLLLFGPVGEGAERACVW